jgi:molecular chaperone HscA
MRQDGPYGLGVDLGTSNTVAVLHTPDGRTRPLLFDGQPLMPSGVFLDQQGRLHVGRDAQRLAQADPARYEPNPKRRIDETSVLLGEGEVPVVDLLAALLGAVARAAVETVGFLPPAMLTHPAAWGPVRRDVLAQAVARAGWPPVTAHPGQPGTRFTPEPVAAARYFAEVLSRPVPVGSSLAVFDFGGGTLDIAVVRNDGLGPAGRPVFSVVSSGGVADLGGLDLDAALVEKVGRSLTGPPPEGGPDGPTQRLDLGAVAAWQALEQPASTTQWRNRRQLWDDVRGAKEMLSRTTVAPVAIPGVEHAVHLTREELEQVVTPLLRRGVHEAAGVIRAAGVAPNQLAGLFLVGGSSRVPMVGRLLHSDLHIPPTVLEQPELPVAEGALAELLAGTTSAVSRPVSPAGPHSPAPQFPPPQAGPHTPAAQFAPPQSPAGPRSPAPHGAAAYSAAESDGADLHRAGMQGAETPRPGKAGQDAAPRRGRRRLLLAGAAAAVAVVLAVTATAVYLTRGRVSPVTFTALGDGTVVPGLEDQADADTNVYYAFTQVVGDRAYVAAQRSDNALEISAIDLTSDRKDWRVVTAQKTYTDWDGFWATDDYVIARGDADYRAPAPLVVFGRDGKQRWERQIDADDLLYLYGDVLVQFDPATKVLRGLRLSDQKELWSKTPAGDAATVEVRLVPVSAVADLGGPARATGRPTGLGGSEEFRLVRVASDRSVSVIDVRSGAELAKGTIALSSPSLISVELMADEDRLYVGAGSSGYRIEAYDLTSFGNPLVVTAGPEDRRLGTIISCGEDLICVSDVGDSGTDQVRELRVSPKAEEIWHADAPRITFDDNAYGGMSAADGGLLFWYAEEGGGYRSVLYSAEGKKVFAWSGVAVRVNAKSFLILDKKPIGSTVSAENVQVNGAINNGDNPEPLGTLHESKVPSCNWNESKIVCASGDNDFRIQRFAE